MCKFSKRKVKPSSFNRLFFVFFLLISFKVSHVVPLRLKSTERLVLSAAWHLTSLYTISVSGAWWWGHTQCDICNCRWACKSRLYCHHQPRPAHIHLFILLDCFHQSEHYKSPPSSIGNLLMHAADQFLMSRANMQSNSCLFLCISDPFLIHTNMQMMSFFFFFKQSHFFMIKPYKCHIVFFSTNMGKRGWMGPCCIMRIK